MNRTDGSAGARRKAINDSQPAFAEPRRLLAVVIVCSLQLGWLSQALFAGEPRVTLFDTDGRETSGSLAMISHESVRLGEPLAEWKWSEVVSLRFGSDDHIPHEPRGSAIWLANGDRLIARGTAIEDEQLRAAWREFPEWPEFALPLECVRGMSLSLPHARERRDEIAAWLFDRKEPRDELRLLNGDASLGEVSGWRGGTIMLKTNGRSVVLPIADVRDIAFNPELLGLPEPKELGWLVSLRDGSRVTLLAAKSRVAGMTLKAAHVSGIAWDIPLDAIRELRVLRGRAVYLSDLTPVESRHTPFLPSSREWPLQRDRSVVSRPLRLGGREFPKGLGMHSRSRTTYDLAEKYQSFHALVGLDDTTVGNGTATCSVEVDGRSVFDVSELSRQNSPRRLPAIDVRGAKRLTLIVDFGELGDAQDHVNWGDAVLVRKAGNER
ncbi:MAG: NPCBM/NEW2 domain-containing protein [Planctomycetaceae bacterium]